MILLVEDHDLSRRTLARQLSLRGYRVMAAADGKDAVDLLDQLSFDLVITDLGLPKLSGFELIGRIRLKSPNHACRGCLGAAESCQDSKRESGIFFKAR
jgi:DNA-binding response OmpR family regulator